MMNNEICIYNATVLTGYSTMNNCAIYIKDNKIIDIYNFKRFNQKQFQDNVQMIDANNAYVASGFVDTHIHGIAGIGADSSDPKDILKMSESLAKYGVTSFIPTLYTSTEENLISSIKAIIKSMGKEKGAKILGIHLEGPFISIDKSGAQSKDYISKVNIDYMKRLIKAAKGNIINMTVAPELKNMRELALFCISENIILQAGHTNATYAQMVEGMNARIMHTTHMFNAMSKMHHRDPGAVGAVFIHPELSCEIIADGIHVNPELIKLLISIKPKDKLVLVTDSLQPTKQISGTLLANNEEVYLDKCFYRKSDNVIAGSALTMIEGVKNLVSFGIDIEQAIKMSSTNPAKIMNLKDIGLIAPGYTADLVIFNKDYNIIKTMINGVFFEEEKI